MNIQFVGTYFAKLDDKSRLVFPSNLKSAADGSGEGGKQRFVVNKHPYRCCLEIYTFEEWEKKSETLKAGLNFYNREDNIIWEHHMRGLAVVEPDEKMGRIQIPKYLLEQIEVRKDVVFVGSYFKIDVWAKEHHVNDKLPDEEFIKLMEKRLG